MMASSSGEGVWPARGAEASGLKCRRKRAEERKEDGERRDGRVQKQERSNNTEGGGVNSSFQGEM